MRVEMAFLFSVNEGRDDLPVSYLLDINFIAVTRIDIPCFECVIQCFFDFVSKKGILKLYRVYVYTCTCTSEAWLLEPPKNE